MDHYSKYRYALSLTSQFYFCGVPLRLDTAPKCTLNCLYCFAMARGGRRTSRTLIASADSIHSKLVKSLETSEKQNDIIGDMLARRMPIHFGGISDPFCNGLIASVSMEILNYLGEYDYPVVVSTKNTRLLRSDAAMKALTKMRHLAVQVSFSCLDPRIADVIEPRVPCPSERLRWLRELSHEGVHVIARLQPLIPSLEAHAAEDLIPELAAAGCEHVVVEHLKLPVEKKISLIKDMFESIHWNGYDFYQQNGAHLVGREWILPRELMWERLQALVSSIHLHGMTYGSADYGLYHMGDTDCCCGIDNLEGFDNWFKGNLSYVIRHAQSSDLTFSGVEHNWFPRGSIRMYVNSNCRLSAGNNVLSYLRQKWNSPGSANAPDSYLGISWHGSVGAEGDHVYTKKEGLCKIGLQSGTRKRENASLN